MGPEVDSRIIIDEIPCAKCGYCLRSCAYDGVCPECGADAGPSVAIFHRLGRVMLSRNQLTWIRRAALLMILTVVIHAIFYQLFYVSWGFGLSSEWAHWLWRRLYFILLRRYDVARCLFAAATLILIWQCWSVTPNRRPRIALFAVVTFIIIQAYDWLAPARPLNPPLAPIQWIGYAVRGLAPTLSCYLGLVFVLLALRSLWAIADAGRIRRALIFGAMGAAIFASGFTIAELLFSFEWPIPLTEWFSIWDDIRRFIEPTGLLGILLAAYALHREADRLLDECWTPPTSDNKELSSPEADDCV